VLGTSALHAKDNKICVVGNSMRRYDVVLYFISSENVGKEAVGKEGANFIKISKRVLSTVFVWCRGGPKQAVLNCFDSFCTLIFS
jgi:hypothetical protein